MTSVDMRLTQIEDRLARLEEAVKLIQFDNDIEPSSVSECKHEYSDWSKL